jgi:hypothetical protein
MSYDNQIGENAIILFLFSDINGRVVSASGPIATQGIGSVASAIFCNAVQPGTYKVYWRAYRASDSKLANEIAWSKSEETQNIVC